MSAQLAHPLFRSFRVVSTKPRMDSDVDHAKTALMTLIPMRRLVSEAIRREDTEMEMTGPKGLASVCFQ